MHSTNYYNTLILVSGDCSVEVSTPPEKPETIAGRQFAMLFELPFAHTSDEILFAIENDRKGPVTSGEFFSRPQACLRASPLVKKHGFGLISDIEGRVALVGMESAEYARLLLDPSVAKLAGMRSARS
jgi:Family of unknown function (DUF6157)